MSVCICLCGGIQVKYYRRKKHTIHSTVVSTNMHEHVLTGERLAKEIEHLKCMRKYAFLYATTTTTSSTTTTTITPIKTKNTFACYVIHKIEIYPSYTYPTVSTNEASSSSTTTTAAAITVTTTTTADNYNSSIMPPYRTVSHYGFNCPLAILPSISLYPKNLINTMNDEFTQYLQLQRHLVIEFLKSAAHNLNANKTTITELDKKQEEQLEEPNYTTVKQLQLMTPTNQKGRQRYWTRTTSTCSSTTPTTATTSSTAEEVETSGMYSYEDADCSAGSCTSLPNKHDNNNNKYLHSYILRKSASSKQSKAMHSLAELEFIRRPKLTEDTHNLEERLEEMKINETAATNVKAKVNATQQTLEILISVHMNRDTQLSELYFKQLTATIDAEMQTIAQELQTNNETSCSRPKTANSNLISSITQNHKNNFEHNLSLLETELEKLLNGILHANILAQNLRSACTEAK